MKNIKIFKTVTFILNLLFATSLFAQSKDSINIPQNVITALKQKYPTAELKGWKTNNNLYIAKIRLKGKRAFAAFSASGNWVNTISKVSWSWDLPKNVNLALKKSQYRSWNVYDIRQIAKPSGLYYQLMVNNANSTEIANSAGHFATERQIEFNADGVLISISDIIYDAIDGH